jgi:hypothetical protein
LYFVKKYIEGGNDYSYLFQLILSAHPSTLCSAEELMRGMDERNG